MRTTRRIHGAAFIIFLVLVGLAAAACRAGGEDELDADVVDHGDGGPDGDAGDAGGWRDGAHAEAGGDASDAGTTTDADDTSFDSAPPDAEDDPPLSCTAEWCLVPESPSSAWGLSVSDSGRPWIVSYGVYTYSGTSWRRYELHWDHPTDPFRRYSELYAVHAVTDRDVWVGGQAGYVGHFNGSSWTDRTAAAPWPQGIWGAASNDVWVFYDSGLVYHWNGTELEYQETAPVDFAGAWGRSATELAGFGHADEDATAPVLYRRDGAGWQQEDLPGPGQVVSLWMVPGGDGWAVVQNGYATGSLLRATDGIWAEVTLPGGQVPRAVWGSAANDVWVVGRGGTISHFEGEEFRSSPSGTTENLHAIDGNGGAIWIAGEGIALTSR